MTPRMRNRIGLILILVLFATPLVTAYVLNAVGWRPAGMRNYGELIEPAQDLTLRCRPQVEAAVQDGDGTMRPAADPDRQHRLAGHVRGKQRRDDRQRRGALRQLGARRAVLGNLRDRVELPQRCCPCQGEQACSLAAVAPGCCGLGCYLSQCQLPSIVHRQGQ